MMSTSTSGDKVQILSNEQLSEVIARCEDAISDGTAAVGDFESFVLAQQELARRTWA
ncbi:hypothetical protein BH23DEI1_BH23DEI1_13170 [soil metagenome]